MKILKKLLTQEQPKCHVLIVKALGILIDTFSSIAQCQILHIQNRGWKNLFKISLTLIVFDIVIGVELELDDEPTPPIEEINS